MTEATIDAANTEQLPALAAFVPSRYRERLRQGAASPELRVVGAWIDGEPVGAGLALVRGDRANGESIAVVPRLRRTGIGRGLLRALEHESAVAGATTMTALLPDDERFLAIRRLLGSSGWDDPTPRHRQFDVDARIRASPTLAESHDLSAYDLVTFSEIDERDRRGLARIAADIAPGLDPLRGGERIVADASLLLRGDGDVVAWAVHEYFAPETTVLQTVWVAPSERGGGLGALLGLLAIRAALDAGFGRIRFVVDIGNTPMIRIVERVVVPYGSSEIGLLETTRSLGAQP